MSNNDKNQNLNLVLENLKELDDICLQMSKEMDQKNRILLEGLKDCKMCKMHIDNICKKKNNSTKQF